MAKNKINLTKILGKPVLEGEENEYMWTGNVRARNITPHLIFDPKSREEFIKIVKKYEQLVIEYRHLKKSSGTVFDNGKVFYPEGIKMLEEQISNISKEINQILIKSKDLGIIDLDLYWIQLCREYEDVLENNPKELEKLSPETRKELEKFRKSINEQPPCVREVYVPTENRYACYQYLTKGQEKKSNKQGSSNMEKLLKLLSAISGKEEVTAEEGMEILKELMTPITLIDIREIFPNQRYADMLYVTILKNYLLKKGYTSEEIESMPLGEVLNKASDDYNKDAIEFHSSLVSDAIVTGLDYVDMDKLLVLMMARPLVTYDLMSPKIDERDIESGAKSELEEIAASKENTIKNFIQRECSINEVIEKSRRTEFIIRKILESGLVSKNARAKIKINQEEETYSLAKIEKMMDRFVDGIYLTDVLAVNLKYNAYVSETELDKWSDDLLKRINFNADDKLAISLMNFGNLERLYKNGIITKEEIKEMLAVSGRKEYDEDFEERMQQAEQPAREDLMQYNLKYLIRNLYDSKILSSEEIIQYLNEGIVTPQMLELIEKDRTDEEVEAIHADLGKHFSKEMLLERYKKYAEKYLEFTKFQTLYPDETDRIEELRKELNNLREEKEGFRELFDTYNPNMNEEQKHDLGNELLSKYYLEMNVEDEEVLQISIKTLYEDGMIDLENIIGLDKKYITPMLDTLSLEDASKIRNSLTDEELEELLDGVFNDKSFSDERKFIIIMNLLGEDTEKDKELREFYLGLLEFDNNSEKKAKSQGGKRKKTGLIPKGTNKYIYPDFVKWKFYKSLDKDVRVKRYANGYVEFASKKLGVRIIEKYYDGDRPAYGTATYILSEKDYRNNEADLITLTQSGPILESSKLKDITPRKDRIAHRTQSADRTWMDDIVKYFDIDYERQNDSRYTVEEIKNLESTVKKYKTQYEMIIE